MNLVTPYVPPSIDDEITFGKHLGISYRVAAQRDPSYLAWAAKNIGGVRGQLCAEALALHLGITDEAAK
jgi:hypothetical protein